MRSPHCTQPSKRPICLLCIILPAILLMGWCLLLPQGTPVNATLVIPAQPLVGQPFFLDVVVNAPVPQKLDLQLPHSLQPLLTLVNQTEDQLAGCSLRGPLWRQRFQIIPTTLQQIPATELKLASLTVKLPALTATLPESLPQEPALLPPATPPAHARRWMLILLPLLGILFWSLCRRHRHSPLTCLQSLPPTPDSLDKLPRLLTQAVPSITRHTHPAFFAQLDELRFSSQPPSPQQVTALLEKARNILLSQA